MGLKSYLQTEVGTIFRKTWTNRDGNVVPDDQSLTLGNEAVEHDATVLCADLADSTKLVDQYKLTFAAEIYKAFLKCATKIINNEAGNITAYDGDRVMAVYIGDPRNTPAVRTAFKITYAVQEIIIPAINYRYTGNDYIPKCVIGIDTSKILVAKTGVRNANDLLWVGRAANYAAKLAALPNSYSTYVTKEVFDDMQTDVKVANGVSLWEAVRWDTFDDRIIYRTNWHGTIT
jgi:uridylate cyclase